MKSATYAWLIGLAITIPACFAAAQELGDAKAGFAYASQVCTQCHAVRSGERVSPNTTAPAFELVANARGMTDMALKVWFRSPHPSMPNLVLSQNQGDDVIAYILSLKKPR
jgi:mono/diheme cytochrome c family protein